MNIPLNIKENYEYVLDFDLHQSHLFRSRRVLTFHVRLMLSTLNACLITARISVPLFPRFAQNVVLCLCWVHREIETRQIHDTK
jgi:hypothetical protein